MLLSQNWQPPYASLSGPNFCVCVTRRYNVKVKRVPAGCQRVHAGCQRIHAGCQRVHAGYQRVHAGYQRVHAGCQRVHAGCQAYLWCGVGPSEHSLCVAAVWNIIRVRVCVLNFVVAYLEITYNITVCAARARDSPLRRLGQLARSARSQ